MKIFHRLGVFLLLVALALQPVSAAPTFVAQAVSSTTGALQGVVKDDTGAPVPGATVSLRGAQNSSTTSDAKGAFQFGNVPAGVYQIVVTKAGYQQAVESDFAIFSNEVEKVAVTLPRATFTSLRTIATVRSAGRGTFNTTPASVNVVSSQDFENQGASGVAAVLNQVPGLQVSMSGNDTNGAAPGAIQYANIRDGLSFETAAEIDGHPLSVGRYGDYVLSFWTPFVFSSFDTIKGPGAEATQTNYAINGTLNMRTLDPTQQFESSFTAGVGSYGDTYFNARYSGTTGRLGFVADIGEVDQESPLDNQQVDISNETSGGYIDGNKIGYLNNLSRIPGTTLYGYNNYSALVCCYSVSGSLSKLNELLKLRYRFSGATTATVSYLGSQATSDENGDTLEMMPSIFQPGAGYNPGAGGPQPGAHVLVSNVYPAPDVETNNEPLFQAEVSSTIGPDTVLARYYHTSIQRFIQQGNSNPNVPNIEYDTLNGTDGGTVFNNFYTPVSWYEYYAQSEDDTLSGYDLEYQHPYGVGNTLTASFSHVSAETSYFYSEANTSAFPTVTASVQDVSIPQGTAQVFNTYRLSDLQNFGQKFDARLSLYENQYQFTAPISCGIGAADTGPGECLLDGSNATFQTTNPTHFDGRLGLTYRPSTNLIFRASAGSSIAPPYMGLLSHFPSVPSCGSGGCNYLQPITINENNPNLAPETAFGYDFGVDVRPRANYYASADAYLTDLYNQFLTTDVFKGYCTSQLYPSSKCGPAGSESSPPLFAAITGNLNNARYEGIELTLRHLTADGIGWLVQGSTQRGYAYNLGADFYCNDLPVGTPCTPAHYNQNLGVVANQNFSSGGAGTYYLNPAGTGGSGNANGVSNQAVPYLDGYAEVNWQNPAGWYASYGVTLFGKNNSYNEPPFTVARVTLRAPLSKQLSLQVSGYNIFNQYSGFFPIIGGGVGIPLANGGLAPSLGNVVGPSTWVVQLKDVIGGSL